MKFSLLFSVWVYCNFSRIFVTSSLFAFHTSLKVVFFQFAFIPKKKENDSSYVLAIANIFLSIYFVIGNF
jgi:hypothetical protein